MSDPDSQETPWPTYRPDAKAIEETLKIEDEDLAMPSFQQLAEVAMSSGPNAMAGAAIGDVGLRAVYFNALLDLHKLIEEYRFHVAFAHLIVLDGAEKVEQGESRKARARRYCRLDRPPR